MKYQIQQLKSQNPYPESVFTEPTESEVALVGSLIVQSGFSSDRIFGWWGRKVWNMCCEQLEKNVADIPTNKKALVLYWAKQLVNKRMSLDELIENGEWLITDRGTQDCYVYDKEADMYLTSITTDSFRWSHGKESAVRISANEAAEIAATLSAKWGKIYWIGVD